MVHGDYDMDGIAAAALLTLWIRALGGRAEAIVPDRARHGYDLSAAGVARAAARGARVLVTVDCGIVALDPVLQAVEAGMDVIVSDHHTPWPRASRGARGRQPQPGRLPVPQQVSVRRRRRLQGGPARRRHAGPPARRKLAVSGSGGVGDDRRPGGAAGREPGAGPLRPPSPGGHLAAGSASAHGARGCRGREARRLGGRRIRSGSAHQRGWPCRRRGGCAPPPPHHGSGRSARPGQDPGTQQQHAQGRGAAHHRGGVRRAGGELRPRPGTAGSWSRATGGTPG